MQTIELQFGRRGLDDFVTVFRDMEAVGTATEAVFLLRHHAEREVAVEGQFHASFVAKEGVAFRLPVQRAVGDGEYGSGVGWTSVLVGYLYQSLRTAHIDVLVVHRGRGTDVLVGQGTFHLVVGDEVLGIALVGEQGVVGAYPDLSEGTCLQRHDVLYLLVVNGGGGACVGIKLV